MFDDNLFDKCLDQVMIQEGFITNMKAGFAAKRSANYNKNKDLTDSEIEDLKKVARDIMPKATRIVKKYGFTNILKDLEPYDPDEYGIVALDKNKDIIGNDSEEAHYARIDKFDKAFNEVEKLVPTGYELTGYEYDMAIKVDRNSDKFKGISKENFVKMQEIGKKLIRNIYMHIENDEILANIWFDEIKKIKYDYFIIGRTKVDSSGKVNKATCRRAIQSLCDELTKQADGFKVKYVDDYIVLTQ